MIVNYPDHVQIITATGLKSVAEYFREKYPEEVYLKQEKT